VTLYVGQPVVHVDQKTCPVTQTYQVGALDSTTKMTLAPTTQTPGQSVISGENSSSISCSVTGSKGNFKFSGSLHAITPLGDQISLTFTNGIVGPDFTGTADVAVYTPQLSANFASSMSCTLQILGGAGNEQIKGGSMWASFACAQIVAAPSGLCGIASASVIVFENCAGS
jgi:hypothetical protein